VSVSTLEDALGADAVDEGRWMRGDIPVEREQADGRVVKLSSFPKGLAVLLEVIIPIDND